MRKINIIILALILILTSTPMQAEAFSFFKKKPKQEQQQETTPPVETTEEDGFIMKEKTDLQNIIKAVEIEGNSIIKEETIKKTMYSKIGEEYNVDILKEDLQNIYNLGYFTKNIKAVPQKTQEGVILKIIVQENIPIVGFTLQGNTVIENKDLLAVINQNIGMPQNITVLNDMIDQIEDLYKEKGYTLAQVKNIKEDPDGYIDIEIDEGQIDDITISGNIKTKDFVIKRNISIKKGDIYNEFNMASDIQRIIGTRAFSDVKRTISTSEKDPTKYSIALQVEEKRSGSVSIGGGFDTAAGMFGSAGFTDYNFRGLGQTLGVDFMTGSGIVFNNSSIIRRASYQAEARFFEPAFLQTKNSFQAKIFARDYASWQVPLASERRLGTEVELLHPIKDKKYLRGGVTLGLEGIKIKEGSLSKSQAAFANAGVDFSKRAQMLVGGTFLSLGPKLVYDTRDNIFSPREGVYASIMEKELMNVGGPSSSFGKVEACIQKYFPVGQKSTLALMGKMGTNIHGNAPLFAQYNLGGIRSIRGFKQTEAGNGNGMMMATAELRTPIPLMDKITKNGFFNDIRLVAFLDAGQVMQKNIVNDIYNYPGYGISTGLGLRIYIPGVGPIKLDYGFPLTNVGAGHSHTGRFLFDIGEMY